MKTVAIFLLLAFAALGCNDSLTWGIIIDKVYHEQVEYTYFSPMQIGTTTIMMPHQGYIPEQWEVVVHGVNIEGDTLTESYSVSEELYKQVAVGDTIPVN